MTLAVPITPDVEAKLRERAAECGRDVADYAADLIRQAVTAPTFEVLVRERQQRFTKLQSDIESGMVSGDAIPGEQVFERLERKSRVLFNRSAR